MTDTVTLVLLHGIKMQNMHTRLLITRPSDANDDVIQYELILRK